MFKSVIYLGERGNDLLYEVTDTRKINTVAIQNGVRLLDVSPEGLALPTATAAVIFFIKEIFLTK